MSDDERLDLRNLPPVEENVEAPRRISQTLAKHADRCMRSAFLYLKYSGGTPGHALDRGSAYHLFQERAMRLLLEEDEAALVPELAKVMVDEVLDDHPEWTVPRSEADDVRVMAYHWTIGNDVDPATVVAVERKFVLELGGVTISGKIDLAALMPDGVLQIDDAKTSFAMPTQAEYEESFQTLFYSLLYLFGNPVEKVPDEHGELQEIVLPAVGEGLWWVRTREVYPRLKLREDGTLAMRTRTLSRTDVEDFKHDLARTIRKILGALEDGKWSAVPGSHCSECPCSAECPLPPHLRDHAGTINSVEEAQEAMAAVLVTKAQTAAMEKEIKAWCKGNTQSLVVGDLLFEWTTVEKWDTDWDELEPAIDRAANFGEPFALSEYRRRGVSNTFKKRKLTPDEVKALRDRELGAVEIAEEGSKNAG